VACGASSQVAPPIVGAPVRSLRSLQGPLSLFAPDARYARLSSLRSGEGHSLRSCLRLNPIPPGTHSHSSFANAHTNVRFDARVSRYALPRGLTRRARSPSLPLSRYVQVTRRLVERTIGFAEQSFPLRGGYPPFSFSISISNTLTLTPHLFT